MGNPTAVQNGLPPLSGQGDLIKVSIVDDEAAVRACIQEILELSGEIRCVGSHASAEEALKEIPRVRPQVVLMDIRMPGMSGTECARRLKALLPALVVVFVSGYTDAFTLMETLETDADTFLVKPVVIAQLLTTIRFSAGRRSANDVSALAVHRHWPHLNERQTAVMDRLAKGHFYKEIADEIHMSEASVRRDVHSIYLKLNVNNRVEATLKWLGSHVQ